MKEIIEKGIEAILPVYIEDKGNCTIIYTKEDDVILKKAIKSTIRNLCKYYHLDLKESNKTYGNLLSINKQPPIPLTPNQVFVPIKVRKPIISHDGAYGYINIDSIERISRSDSSPLESTIHLKSKRTINAICRDITIKNNINKGHLARQLFNRYDVTAVREDGNYYEMQDSPATKRDIAMIYKEIMELKRMK